MTIPSRRFTTAAAFCAGLAFLAGPSIASAQVEPPGQIATPVTVAQSRAGNAGDISPKAKKKKPTKFEHFEIAPAIIYTMASGSDVIPQKAGVAAPNDMPFDLLRLAGSARYRFNKHLGVQYQRIAHTGAGGRTYKKGIGSYGGSGYDYEDRELATWSFNPYLTFRSGYHYRARVCCPGAGDPDGIPRFIGGLYNDLTWRFGPNGLGGKPLTASVKYEQDYHRFTAAAQKNLTRGESDDGQRPTFGATLYSNFYLYHQKKLVPYYGLEYFSTYFSNNPRLSETYRKVYGVTYHATNDLSWKFYVKNDQPGGPQTGNGTHKSTAFLEASYRFHR